MWPALFAIAAVFSFGLCVFAMVMQEEAEV